MKKPKIYFDNCAYNRPYDDQDQVRVQLETGAKLYIQELIKTGKIDLVCSFVSRFENDENPNGANRDSIELFFRNAVQYIGNEDSDNIREKAGELMGMGIKMKDAAHLACAING